MTIRKARRADLATVNEITRRAYEPYVQLIGSKPMPMTEDYAPHIAAGEVWLLEENATVAGLIVLEAREGGALLIYSVAIAPEHQGRGLGRRLLSFAEEVARERGLGVVTLYTNARMERNIGIYRRFGFIETRRRAHPTRAGIVVVDMHKKLAPANRRSA